MGDGLKIMNQDNELFINTLLSKINNDKLISKQEIKKLIQILSQKSKMAVMGEMMDTVAHQWKQPLNALTMMTGMLKSDFKNKLITQEYIDDFTDTADMQIAHMIDTISEFRTFARPETEIKYPFLLNDVINSVKVLMQDELIIQNITIETHIEENLKINGLKNKFKHIFINFITNSCEEFTKRKKLSRYIYIRAYTKNNKIIIEVEDTAGGIDEEIINDIFKANFTTKKEKDGTGIGLFLITQILQDHNANIEVKNLNLGTLFTISLPKTII